MMDDNKYFSVRNYKGDRWVIEDIRVALLKIVRVLTKLDKLNRIVNIYP